MTANDDSVICTRKLLEALLEELNPNESDKDDGSEDDDANAGKGAAVGVSVASSASDSLAGLRTRCRLAILAIEVTWLGGTVNGHDKSEDIVSGESRFDQVVKLGVWMDEIRTLEEDRQAACIALLRCHGGAERVGHRVE